MPKLSNADDLGAANYSTAITASASPIAFSFRALRFGGPTAGATGTVTVTYTTDTGGADVVTEGVTVGEIWNVTNKAVPIISAISGVTVRALR